MNSDLQRLMELQVADSAIARLKEEIASLPRKVAVIEQKLAGTKAQLEKAQAVLKADETARRKFEQQINDVRQKISKYRDQSLDVKTNDQYKALMHEIEFAEKEIAACEDKILELMLDADARVKDVKAAEAELKEETAEIENEKAETRARTAEDQTQLAEWAGKRDGLHQGISPDILRHYERVLKFRGSALSEARDHKCSVCQVVLRPQVYNDILSNEQIVICDSCQRILFYDPAHAPQVQPKPARPATPDPDLETPADNAALS